MDPFPEDEYVDESGELRVIQRRVKAAGGQKLSVGARLGYKTVPDDQDAIGVLDRGETVRDDEAGAPLHKLVEGVLNQLFGAAVHVGGSFVQNEDGGVRQHGAGDGEELLLSFGNVDAVIRKDGHVAVG